MPTTVQEWVAFIALVPYFSACQAEPKIHARLLATFRRCEEPILSRETLLLRAGLSFFAEDIDVNLALMRFVREGWLVPLPDRPFTFAVNLHKQESDATITLKAPPSGLADA